MVWYLLRIGKDLYFDHYATEERFIISAFTMLLTAARTN